MIRLVGGHRYVAATKAALAEMGRYVGGPRAPRLPLPNEEVPGMREALLRSGIKLAGVPA